MTSIKTAPQEVQQLAQSLNSIHEVEGLPEAARVLAQKAEASAEAWLKASVVVPPVVAPPAPPVGPPTPPPIIVSPTALPKAAVAVKAVLFDDEFAGTTLDQSKWQPYVTWTENNVQTVPANVVVNNGVKLKLTSPTAGALITSQGKFSFQYGYMETEQDAAITLAGDGGLANWSAGMWTGSLKWPTTGELDVNEVLGNGNGGQGTLRCTLHYNSNNSAAHPVGPGFNGETGEYTTLDLSKPHVFGADWQPDKIDIYSDPLGDGVIELLGTITEGVTDALGPWFLTSNIGTSAEGADWGGEPVVPDEIGLKYWRVWSTESTQEVAA